jgi:hypothetical protein
MWTMTTMTMTMTTMPESSTPNLAWLVDQLETLIAVLPNAVYRTVSATWVDPTGETRTLSISAVPESKDHDDDD